jgi:hypothetical protein
MTTATIAEMEERHLWFRRLDAEHRSWITLVAQAGIDGFVKWFAAPGPEMPSTSEVFGSAPRELARKISLYQTVELVRTTIEVVEKQIDELMPKGDRPILHAAIDQYSREVAFSAAEIYARAAELRGAWDERLEALVVDAVLRGETDETVLSRASTLGWHSTIGVVVVVGPAPQMEPGQALEAIRHTAAIAGTDMLGAVQGDRMIVVLGGSAVNAPDQAVDIVGRFVTLFGPGAVIVGPPVEHLMDAATSTREAVSAYRAAAGWPEAPRPVTSLDLLPERALSGDGHARRALAHDIYEPLQLPEAACSRRSSRSWIKACRWRPRRARCSFTPIPSATGCDESMRSPDTARPIRATPTRSDWRSPSAASSPAPALKSQPPPGAEVHPSRRGRVRIAPPPC